MASMGISSVQPKYSNGFMMLLSCAVCEWFLIFMLFVDAGLSYLLTKFAQYCDLQTPCPLCSRIDHVFEKRNPGYYRSLLCSDHREEISCLVKCNNHDKLVIVHAMCEDCITSFIKATKSSSESYRLMLEKIGTDIEESCLNKNFMHDSSSQKTCSCCSKILRATPKIERYFQVTQIGLGASKANVKPPLPRVPGRSRFSRRNSLKRLRDKITGPSSPRSAVNASIDKLSHVGYTELKITSESESEVPMSDDGYSTSAACRKRNHKAKSYTQKQMRQSSKHLPSLVDFSVFRDSSELNSTNCLTPDASVHHDLDNPIALPEMISLDDALKDSAVTIESNALIKHGPNVSILPEVVQVNHVDSSSNETIRGDQDELLRRSGSVGSSDATEMIQMDVEFGIHDSGDDTMDSISVKEIEGESVVERLKRQVDYDRRFMKTLYKELEEERNAAAIAANQAMAMITRLQQEKASLHMEALQYLRMMEEQAMYDMEALEKANELLSEREKEIKDMEAELEIYKYNYLDEPVPIESTNSNSITNQDDSNFECEKVYISQCLQLLGEKLQQLSIDKEKPPISHENGNSSFSIQTETSPESTPPSHVLHSADLVTENHLNKQTQIDAFSGQTIDDKIDSFQRAITDLHDRLRTLEVDRNILKLAFNSLQNRNNEGFQFLQQISHYLQQLRNVDFSLPP